MQGSWLAEQADYKLGYFAPDAATYCDSFSAEAAAQQESLEALNTEELEERMKVAYDWNRKVRLELTFGEV